MKLLIALLILTSSDPLCTENLNHYKPVRTISNILTPFEKPEGSGAKVKRIIGTKTLRHLDPFLMFDHFKVSKPNGFPDHPHRGFETVTYMINGTTLHEDFKGHSGAIHTGSVQWMTAGRGIIHAEMPGSETIEGLQLWVNLKSELKMCEPDYQEKDVKDLLKTSKEGVEAVVIAGEVLGVKSDFLTRTPMIYIDFQFDTGKELYEEIEDGWNGLVYIIEGEIEIEERRLSKGKVGILGNTGDLKIVSNEKSRFFLIAGKPLEEPIVQNGPFVMNYQSEIQQAFSDYKNSENGFEGARNWKSTIGKRN